MIEGNTKSSQRFPPYSWKKVKKCLPIEYPKKINVLFYFRTDLLARASRMMFGQLSVCLEKVNPNIRPVYGKSRFRRFDRDCEV